MRYRQTIRLLAIFVFATNFGCTPKTTSETDLGLDITTPAVQQEKRFWELLREATQARIDGDSESAFAVYSDALEIKPNHEDALYYLGNVSRALGRNDIAVSSWKRLLESNPMSARAHLQLGTLSVCKEHPERADLLSALASFEAAHALNREESGALLRLAEVSILLGEYSAAASHLDDVIRFHKDNIEARFLRAWLTWKSGRKGEVKEEYAALMQLMENAPDRHEKGLGEGDTVEGEAMVMEDEACPAIDRLLPGFLSDARRMPETAVQAFAQIELPEPVR